VMRESALRDKRGPKRSRRCCLSEESEDCMLEIQVADGGVVDLLTSIQG
jgi:hypothetical protein